MFFFFSSRRRHTRCSRDWSSDVCSSDLFQRAPAFRGAELLRGTGDDVDEASSDPVYWTVDRWDSREAYEDFNTRFEREYEELDTRLADLCELEVCLGKFEVVD